jgi:uncharacterized membrane protein YdjX (TVP38/TMEM64 family)
MPLIMSGLTLFWLYQKASIFESLNIFQIVFFTILASLAMGLAIVPTSLVALIAGYFWAWASLPFLIVSYCLATFIGYAISKKIDNNQLVAEISKNEKVKKMLENLKSEQFKLIVLARLSPIFPFGISNVVFTYLGVKLPNLISAGILGMLPRTIFMVLIAKNTSTFSELLGNNWQSQFSSPLFLLGLLSGLLLIFFIYKAYQKI